ncbi:MAG: hypothetical protein RXR31_02525 [Thermoproteota archaeon]|jgi:hypothetical protein
MMLCNRELILSDPISSTIFMIKHIKNVAEKGKKVFVIDNKGIISNNLEMEKISLNKISLLNNQSFDIIRIIDVLSASLNLKEEERTLLLYSIYNLKESKLKISKIIEKVASIMNAFVNYSSYLVKLQEIIAKLSEIQDLDNILANENSIDIFEELEKKDCIIVNISNVKNFNLRIFLTLLILDFVANENKTDMNIFVDNTEGKSILCLNEEFICRLLDELAFNNISYCFSACLEELNDKLYSRFSRIYYISYNNSISIKNCFIDGSPFNLVVIENNKVTNKSIIKFGDITLERGKAVTPKAKEIKTLLEINYGNLADLIADLIIEIEKNVVRRSEIKHLMSSLGYFIDDWDNLIDTLLRDGLLEEKLFSGIKKIIPTYKGIFMANEHKNLK